MMSIEASIRRAWCDAVVLGAGQWACLERHLTLLRLWNARVNLVGASTIASAAVKHYCESLFLAARLPDEVGTVVDIGSGAGFPGFPLAVMCPNVQVVLIESDKRKAAFLRESCGLPNLQVATIRMENYKGACDAVITRAVDPHQVRVWAAGHAKCLGFIGSMRDILTLSKDAAFATRSAAAFPWAPRNGSFWGTFHVKPH